MLPLRQNNPLAPAAFNGLSSIGYDSKGVPFQDKIVAKSGSFTIPGSQTLLNQRIDLDKDADFQLYALSVQAPNQPFAMRISDSTGYEISQGFIGSFAFTSSTGIGAPFVMPINLPLAAGSSVMLDFIDQSGSNNGPIQVLAIGSKRFPGTGANEIAYKQRLINVVDGWGVNTAAFPNPRVYQFQCISAMTAARLANNYRPKIYAIPDQSAIPARANPITTNAQAPGMTPFSTYTTQVRMVPGTFVLGMSLAVVVFVGGAPGVYEATTFEKPDNFYVTATDDATGAPFFSDWPAELSFNIPVLWQGQALLPPFINRQVYVSKTAWLPLTKPRSVLAPAIVTVNMCYKDAIGGFNIAPQLLMYCAEPCGASAAKIGACD